MIPEIEAQAKDDLAPARNRNRNDEMWIVAGLHSNRVRWPTVDSARFRHYCIINNIIDPRNL